MEQGALWRKVIFGIHNLERKPITSLAKLTIPGVWLNITKTISAMTNVGINFSYIFKFKIGSGWSTLFWLDDWTGDGVLASRFPRLYTLDKRKSSFIAERLDPNIGEWKWRRKPAGQAETDELQDLQLLVDSVNLSREDDTWNAELSADGKFYVHDVRNLMDSFLTKQMENDVIWLNLIPLKINCFIWRAIIGRIPTATALGRRGIRVIDNSCPWCNEGLDEANHCLIGCNFSTEVLKKIMDWCSIDQGPFSDIKSVVSFAANWGNCPKKRKIFLSIIYGFLWTMWKARNNKIFNKVCGSKSVLVDNVISLVFSWMKHRGNFKNCNWLNWCCNPFNIL